MAKSNQTSGELALFYEARRGDVADWKPSNKKKPTSRGAPSSVFSVRFTQEELRTLQAAAGGNNQPVSTYIREAALESARQKTSVVFHFAARGVIEEQRLRRIASLALEVACQRSRPTGKVA